MKTRIQPYERLKIIPLEDGFALINSGDKTTIIDGKTVHIRSMRLLSFVQNGVKCANPSCSYEGSYWAIERSPGQGQSYHLNLWGRTEDDTEVLMTCDHVIAQALGGLDELCNTQTMCCWCNWKKGAQEGVQAKEIQRERQIAAATLKFTYIGLKDEPRVFYTNMTTRRTFNFYLNDPGTWATEDFLHIVWKNCGFLCSEVRLVNNDFVHPDTGKLAHRYDLTFLMGPGLLKSRKDVNVLMRKMEKDIRAKLNVEMRDTHVVPEEFVA